MKIYMSFRLPSFRNSFRGSVGIVSFVLNITLDFVLNSGFPGFPRAGRQLPQTYYYRPQRNWGKVMFLQASVILLTGGCLAPCMLGLHTPPGSRHLPKQKTPRSRYPPRADTAQSRHPPPGEQTPPRADNTPEQTPPPRVDTAHPTHPEQTPPGADPPTADTPPSPAQSMLGDTFNVRAVPILLECNLVLPR